MKHFITFISTFMLISNLFAGVIRVPEDQPNIQAGIMWASNGDTVLVSSGTYTGAGNVDINFFGKALHLLSVSGSASTTIDLQDENRAFYFSSGEDTTSIIDGFTIKNGNVDQYEGNISDDYGYGGAVYIGDTAYPKFANCRFEYNDSYNRGDAVSIRNGGNAIFEDCHFYYNYRTDGSRQGGAVEVHNSSATFRGTTFDRNGDYSEYDGGALYIYSDDQDNNNRVDIINCDFTDNGTTGGSSYGGAIYLRRTELHVRDSYFYENQCNNNGGAIYIESYSPNIYIDNCIFDYNGRNANNGGAIHMESYGDTLFVNQSTFTRNGWGGTSYGGAMYIYRSRAVINNSEITGNVATSGGSGIEYRGNWSDNYLEINFSTIAHNYSNTSHNTTNSLHLRYSETDAVINNSIISYGYYDGANSDNLQLSNSYTDAHNNRLYLDNHYEMGHFKLAAHSPALGYGQYDERFQYDRDGNPRVSPDGSNPDVGCYESTRSSAASTTTIYVSTEGDDQYGSGESDNPYKSIYMGVRASHYNYSDIISLAPGTYNEDDYIRLRGRKVHIKSQGGSDTTVAVFPGTLAFTNESSPFTNNYANGLYTNTLEGLDIRINNSTEYGIYMYDEPIHLVDMIIEDEIYSEKTGFNIDGLRSYTSEGFTNGLIRLYNQNDNEDFTYNFNNLDIVANNSQIIYMYHNYNSNYRDMDVYITNSTLRAGSSGSGDVFTSGCCTSNSNDERIFIEDSFIEGDINHRGLRNFYAYRTVFKNTNFDISNGNGDTGFQMENCTVDNGYFYTDGDGLIKNTIFYPNIEFDNYSNQSSLEFQYNTNIPEDAPDIGIYNISADPLFVDRDNENYNLMPGSPCIDVAHPDNDDDDSNWDVDSDDQDPDGSRLDMGVFPYDHYGAYEAVITSVNDVPDDQGGLLRVSWDASPNDVENGNITHYGVWRINEDGEDVLSLVPAVQDTIYNFVATTVNDSVPGNPNAETFVVTAHTPDLEIYYSSDPASGYSIDNIAPSIPQTFSMSNNNNIVMLSWDENTEEDFDYYSVYRNGEKVVDLAVTYFEELNFGALSYYVTATDYHGNESEPTEMLNIQLNLPGDVNLDDVVNVFDIVLMVEYILSPEESDFTDLEFGLADVNYDGELNILDIMHWINVILGLGREDINMAQSAKLFIQKDKLTHKADGLVGYHITLAHAPGLEITLTEAAMLTDFVTHDNVTEVIILNPESEILFTTNGEFEILEVMTANAENIIATDVILVPDEFRLKSIYPNPFNPVTNISVDLPEETMLSVMVYDLNGRLVATLVDKRLMDPGNQMIAWDAGNHASGVYLISVSALESSFTQRITLLK